MGSSTRAAASAALFFLFFLLLHAPAASAIEETGLVVMKDYLYEPAKAYVLPGHTLLFRNNDTDSHTVTSEEGVTTGNYLFDSGQMGTHGEYRFNATLAPGEYGYWCVNHPEMRGTIVVLNADGTSPVAEKAGEEGPKATPILPAAGLLMVLAASAFLWRTG